MELNKYIILGHENPDIDSIVSGIVLEKIMKKLGYNVEFIIPDESIEEEIIRICVKYNINIEQFQKNIIEDDTTKYILVDHHERNLNKDIVAIIDHHPTIKTYPIKNNYNVKSSSTAIFIAKNKEDLLDKEDFILIVLATLVDTASFHSNKTKESDIKWVNEICKKYNFNYKELYQDGLCLTELSDLNKAALNGLKKHIINGQKLESSYIQIESIDEIIVNKIINKLKKYYKEKELYAFIFIVHDMKNFKTDYYYITENTIEKKEYDSYTSRGNTIIPEIERKILLKK